VVKYSQIFDGISACNKGSTKLAIKTEQVGKVVNEILIQGQLGRTSPRLICASPTTSLLDKIRCLARTFWELNAHYAYGQEWLRVRGGAFGTSRSHYGPGVDSASHRNEFQEYFLGGKLGRCVWLTTLPPSSADCLEIWEPQTPGTLRACPGL
jgi:hypothetical protein